MLIKSISSSTPTTSFSELDSLDFDLGQCIENAYYEILNNPNVSDSEKALLAQMDNPENQNPEKGIAIMNALLAQYGDDNPNAYFYHFVKGGMNFDEAHLPIAMEEMNQAIALNSEFAPAYFIRGMLHLQQMNFAAYQADIDKAEKLINN